MAALEESTVRPRGRCRRPQGRHLRQLPRSLARKRDESLYVLSRGEPPHPVATPWPPPRGEDSPPRGQERQEAGGSGRGEEARRATASVVGDGRDLRTAPRCASTRRRSGLEPARCDAEESRRRGGDTGATTMVLEWHEARPLSPERASDPKATAPCELGPPSSEERPMRRLQRLLGSPKRRISRCTEPPKRV